MVSATLKTQPSKIDPCGICEADRGSGRNNLYGSNNPRLNLAHQRVRAMSPDELFSAGYRHGLENAGMRGSMSGSPDYIRGWKAGYAARQPALTIWRHWDLNRVSSALKDLREWKRDQAKHSVGAVALALSNGKWLVLVSQDLIEAVLPF